MNNKNLEIVRCDICDKTFPAGDAFSVIHVGGFFVNGFLSGEDGGSLNDNEVVKYYLCSSSCRSKHIGRFWRAVFPIEE